jgi:type I restriction enzyme R subunit
LERRYLSEEEEKRIRKAFIKPDEKPKILIVTEKLLTGYDAPILYCMYLDKPMRDHVLLQAIARVNRPYEDERGRHKPGGFVLDFVGVLENLEKALAFDSQDMKGVIEGLDVLEARFRERMAFGRAEYLPLVSGKSADKAAESALDAFRDKDKRQTYYGFFQELEDLYEILSPDPFLREYIDDYHRLADLYDLLRAAYEAKSPAYRELARKTAQLVQEYTHGGAISQVINVLAITPETLAHLAESNQPDTVKVFNLIKSIEHKVQTECGNAPYLISIGERAEAIAEMFKQHQIEAQEALKQLEAVLREINEAERAQAERNISGAPFAILWLLKQADVLVDQAEAVARAMVEEFARHPHWRTSEHQARDVRQSLYLQLLPLGIKNLPQIVDHIMSVITRDNQK